MNQLNFNDIIDFIDKNMFVFHQKRIKSLSNLKLLNLLKTENPYFICGNRLTAGQFICNLVDAQLRLQEEVIFADLLKMLSIYVNKRAYGGYKSTLPGIDLEFHRDNIKYIVIIKSDPNWENECQIEKLRSYFKHALEILLTSDSKMVVQSINGCFYGWENKPDKGGYFKYCGEKFWEFISGNKRLYLDIIEPLGKALKERTATFDALYARTLNKLSLQFHSEFYTSSGEIEREKIVKLISADPKDLQIKFA